jgi:DNA primase
VLKRSAEEILLSVGDSSNLPGSARTYRVRGLARNTGYETLRVSLRVACGSGWHLDTLDLAQARQRAAFVAAAAEETGLKLDLLKRDVGRVLLKLEELHEEELLAQVAPKEVVPPMTEAEREAALALLKSSDLWKLISEHAATCGIAGEKTNVLAGYLGAVSRLLDRPLAIVVQSSSAAGKTTLMDAILAFVPPEARNKYSALTGQSLFYLGRANLRNKILAIAEQEGAERASYALKLLQSEGELRLAATGKDEHSGRTETQSYVVMGPVMIFLTTTAPVLDEELQNRCIVLTVDESREQTERIHALQREARTEAGLARKVRREELLALHRNAQRLLQALPVFNPYAARLRFLSDQLRTRRDHEKYLLLIDSLAVLFQHQRARKTIAGRECVVASLDDIARANSLAHEILGRGLEDMPPQARRLLGLIQHMQKEKGDAPWRRRDLRAFTGWSDTALKVHLGRLVELEYVLPRRDRKHAQSLSYELLYDGDAASGRPHLSGLLDVSELREAATLENRSGENADRSGASADRSGTGQPAVSPRSGSPRQPLLL